MLLYVPADKAPTGQILWKPCFERIGGRTINDPIIIPRAQHIVSRAQISESALKVLHRLKEAGYASLLVGGCVRDLMLGREPKDFDVVTDARPEQIRKLFHNAHVDQPEAPADHARFRMTPRRSLFRRKRKKPKK